jgi:hypothetical protein
LAGISLGGGGEVLDGAPYFGVRRQVEIFRPRSSWEEICREKFRGRSGAIAVGLFAFGEWWKSVGLRGDFPER